MKNFFKYFLLMVFLFAKQAVCQVTTSDPAYANMQRAIGGIIQQNALNRGYSTSDPRTYSTLYSVGKTAATAAAGVGAGLVVVGTAPGWLSVMAAAVVGGVVSYAVGQGLDWAGKWLFKSTGVEVTTPSSDPNASLKNGSSAYKYGQYWSTSKDMLTDMVAKDLCQGDLTCVGVPPYSYMAPDVICVGHVGAEYIGGFNVTRCVQASKQTYTGTNCAVGQGFDTSTGLCFTPLLRPSTNPSTPATVLNQTLAAAIQNLTDAQKQAKVDYKLMADTINYLWKQSAAQVGYAGVPYDVTNPVTATEVEAWAKTNQTSYPTVAQAASAVSSPSGFAVDSSTAATSQVQPVVSPLSPTAINPSTQTLTNLGPDPNITAPSIQDPPTAQVIFKPFLDLISPILHFNFNAPSGECPRPDFDVFGKQVTMKSHCDIAENNRASLSLIMNAVFMISALFIIFKA
jgi:hypothetical protein